MAAGTCVDRDQLLSLWDLRLFVALALSVIALAGHHARPCEAGQDEADPEDFLPGVRLELRSSVGRLVTIRERPTLQTVGGRLDPRLSAGGTAEFSGLLLVRSGGAHRFHVQLSGDVQVLIDDRVVLQASGEDRFFSGDPLELSGGEHALKIVYRVPAAQSGSEGFLNVFWSSPEFTLEPLPSDILSVLPEAVGGILSTDSARGRHLTDAYRCGACHLGWSEGEPVAGPNLSDSIRWLSDEQVAERLIPGGLTQTMPHFDFTAAEAADVIAFLRAAFASAEAADDSPFQLPEAPNFKSGDAAAGERLLLTMGCLACHEVDNEIPSGVGPWGGPDLRAGGQARRARWQARELDEAGEVGGQAREASWLMQWLRDPGPLNRAHRMPVFELSDEERRQLTAALLERRRSATESRSAAPLTLPEGSAERGRLLVEAAGCRACHEIPGLEVPVRRPFALFAAGSGKSTCADRPARDGVEGSSVSGRPRAPRYELGVREREQLRAWLAPVTEPLAEARGHFAGQLQLERKSCLACHDRDGVAGLSEIAGRIEGRREDLRGQAQALIPPALTAVGDRLRDEVLTEAIGGGVERRLPWLLVRMPRFVHGVGEREALAGLLISEDRIPDTADGVREELFAHYNPQHPAQATPAELYSGNQLAGAGGFQCTACHKAGTWEPRNVAMGTRGSDLMLMGRRLRARYFLRWMQNPIRVVPGIEMPQLRKPVDRGLNETLGQQIAELWKALADPRFVPPTVVSRYEQIAAVLPGERPRVIRDVFLAEGSPIGSGTARALAIGFGNSHSVLLDLDSGRLVEWRAGEFARQRTEGKSWFWDLAGVPLAAFGRGAAEGEFLLRLAGQGTWHQPVRDEVRTAELLTVMDKPAEVVLRLRLHYETERASEGAPADKGSPHASATAWSPRSGLASVVLRITLSAITESATGAGIELKYELESAPVGSQLQCASWNLPRSAAGLTIAQQVLAGSDDGISPAPVTEGDRLELTAGRVLLRRFTASLPAVPFSPPTVPPLASRLESVDCVPGFSGERLPLPTALMPTGMAWFADGRLAISSLRGEVRILRDSDGDGRYDAADLFASGLAAPYGILTDGEDVLVSHKPEVLRLRDSDGDGRADFSEVVASGWGFSDDYHDWTSGLTRDDSGNLYVGLGSDYSQSRRAADNDRWRGTILKIDPSGRIEPLAYSMRFPMGLAFDTRGRLFATDNQGVQNTFNEINHIQAGKRYGVPSRHDQPDVAPESPALQVPHPWTRSVNSLAFFPDDYAVAGFRGQAIGCEYDTQCLIRMSFQDVAGVVQGACYRFSRPPVDGGTGGLQGPISCAFGPDQAIYIGSLRDSGWQGAGNTGCIEKLLPSGRVPNGIREIRAAANGFEVDFFDSLPVGVADSAEAWDLQSLTRAWKGSYATPDSDRRVEVITGVELSADRRSVKLLTAGHRAGYLYEVRMQGVPADGAEFWPAEGFYWMKRVPVLE
jgi:cytochrome c2